MGNDLAWKHANGIKIHAETGEIVNDKTEFPPPEWEFEQKEKP